jgi:phosphoribosylpyrophosphate synthetase
MIIVSPDVGGVVRARASAKKLNDADLAIIDKRRPAANMVKIMNVIGDDWLSINIINGNIEEPLNLVGV